MKAHFDRIRALIKFRGPSHIREGFTMQDALDFLSKVEYIVLVDDETPPPSANANAIQPDSFVANATH
jgi:uncharacterized protein YecE (DUF72 family)